MPVDISPLVASVERAKGVHASAKALIEGFADRVAAAVTAALEADENADAASIEAANAAIRAEADTLNASLDELSSAFQSNQ